MLCVELLGGQRATQDVAAQWWLTQEASNALISVSFNSDQPSRQTLHEMMESSRKHKNSRETYTIIQGVLSICTWSCSMEVLHGREKEAGSCCGCVTASLGGDTGINDS